MSENVTDALGLGLDLSTVDTSRPVLPEGMYALVVDKVEVAPNKAGNGNNLLMVWKTLEDSPDSTGDKVINAGFPLRKYYPLQQSENEKAPDFKQDLARLQDAMEGTTQGNRPAFNPYNYQGRRVIAKLKIKVDDVYGAQNEIVKLEFAAE